MKIAQILRETLTLILAGGQGERLYPLTRDRAKPAVVTEESIAVRTFWVRSLLPLLSHEASFTRQGASKLAHSKAGCRVQYQFHCYMPLVMNMLNSYHANSPRLS